MDLETQQEQFDENIKLNSILSSIDRQNTLLDEISKNNQAARPTNSIVLDKPVLGTDSKNKDPEKNLNATMQDEGNITNINIKEDAIKSDVADDTEQVEEDNVINQETNVLQDKSQDNTNAQVKEDKPTDSMPDWFNIVKNQINELVESKDVKDVVEFNEPNSVERSETKVEERINIVKEPEITSKDDVAKTVSVDEIKENTEEKSLENVEPVVNVNNTTERISEKSRDNFYKISDLKEDSESVVEAAQETQEQEIEPEKETSVINVFSKNKSSSADISDVKVNPETEPVEINENAQEIAQSNSEQTSEPITPASPEQESLENLESNQEIGENIDELKQENDQSSPSESIPAAAQSEYRFMPEETSESNESVNSLETLVSEISEQIVALSQNNDKNFLNIANIMIGISNTLRAMNNNLSNLGGNNVVVNQGENGTGNKNASYNDTYNQSNLARYRQQMRNPGIASEVATRVLRHSTPGVTL
jgi:hypothetical protein